MDPLHIIVSVAGVTILFLVGAVWRISENKFARQDGDINGLRGRLEASATELSDFKLVVAKEYVSRETLREMEDRITSAIEKVAKIQERIFEELKGKADK